MVTRAGSILPAASAYARQKLGMSLVTSRTESAGRRIGVDWEAAGLGARWQSVARVAWESSSRFIGLQR